MLFVLVCTHKVITFYVKSNSGGNFCKYTLYYCYYNYIFHIYPIKTHVFDGHLGFDCLMLGVWNDKASPPRWGICRMPDFAVTLGHQNDYDYVY